LAQPLRVNCIHESRNMATGSIVLSAPRLLELVLEGHGPGRWRLSSLLARTSPSARRYTCVILELEAIPTVAGVRARSTEM
jgi:hypothetical protein